MSVALIARGQPRAGMRKVDMFPRLLSGLALATLLVIPQVASAKGWKDLEARYQETREEVLTLATGGELEATKKETSKDRAKRVRREFAAIPKELFKENPKKATELLLEDLLHEAREMGLAAQAGLSAATGRDSKPLFKAFDREKDPRAKRLLAQVLSRVDVRGAMLSLSKAAKNKDAHTRAAVATAIGDAGAARAKGPGESALRKLLRDKSIRVRYAAAAALRKLGQKADKFPEPDHDSTTGLPDRYAADRVVFLLDATKQAGEEAFEDPFAKDEADEGAKEEGAEDPPKKNKKKKRKKGKDAEPEAPPALSPYQIMGGLVTDAVVGMQETSYQVIRFGSQATELKGGFKEGGEKQRAGLEGWFGQRLSVERDRRVVRAIQAALEGDPDAIYLFICGLPTERGGRDDSDATLEKVGELLWGAGVDLHVIRFVVPPEQDPRTEGAKQARQEFLSRYTTIAGKLAGLAGGQRRTIELTRREEKSAEPEKGDKEKLKVDLTKAISSRDRKAVEKAFREAMDSPDKDAEELVTALGACPDPRNALPLALEALLGDEPTLSSAAARGLAKNADPRVLFAIAKTFRSEKDPANQIRLLHAMGRAPGQSVTDGLVSAAATLPRDPARVAWRYIAERPAAELAAAKAKLVRRARDLTGLSKAYANLALAKAANQPPPARDGLKAAAGQFLPNRFLEGGVAFVIDGHKATKAVFWAPPKPAPAAEDEEPDKKPKRKRGKRKKGEEAKPVKALEPVTVLDAIRLEVTRALEAIGRAEGSANLYVTGGNSFTPRVSEMSRKLEEAKIFLANKIRPGPQRDVLKAIDRALDDPHVERIVVLVSGLPVRSPGDGDPAPFLKAVRKKNAGRAVRIDVVYVLPPVDQKNNAAVARRKDELAGMDRLYGQLAGQNDGKVLVRTRLAGVPPKAAGDKAGAGKPAGAGK